MQTVLTYLYSYTQRPQLSLISLIKFFKIHKKMMLF